MAKDIKAKARAIAEFLAITVAAGAISGSWIPATGRPPKRSAEDLKVFQQYTADVNEVVTELRKQGLPVKDGFKDLEMAKEPAGRRISLPVDFSKEPGLKNRLPKVLVGKDGSRFVEAKAYWWLNGFLETHPKAVSEKTMQRIRALNSHYHKNLEPIVKKYDRKLAASRRRHKIAFGTGISLITAGSLGLQKTRKKKKLIRRQRK